MASRLFSRDHTRRRTFAASALVAAVVLCADVLALGRGSGATAPAPPAPLAVVDPAEPAPAPDPVPPTTGTTAAPTTTVTTPPPVGQKVVMDPAKSWAVLIGVQHYDEPTHPTFGALGDVEAFHRLLLKAGWQDSHILRLTDQGATTAAMRNATRWLVDHSAPDGFSLFHYSGHVLQTGGQELLWGVDNGFIPNGEFGATMAQLRGRAWVDVAGCESAGFDAGVAAPLRFYTSSSMTNEKSYEDPTWAESVWTGFLVDQAMLHGRSGSEPVSIQAAVRWAQVQAHTYTLLQQPYGPQDPYAIGGDGEWYLGPAMGPHA